MTDVDSVLAILVEWYPQTFVREKYKAHQLLKVGVGDDLAECCPALSKRERRLILRAYTSRLMYLRALVAGASRIDLAGEVCGEVTTDQAERVAARIVEILAAREAKCAAALTAKRLAKIPCTIAKPAASTAAMRVSPLKAKPVLRLPAFRVAS